MSPATTSGAPAAHQSQQRAETVAKPLAQREARQGESRRNRRFSEVLAVAKPVGPDQGAPGMPRALPGRWREVGGLNGLVLLDTPARTAGMVLVGRQGEDWARRPELRFQVWPDDLEPMT